MSSITENSVLTFGVHKGKPLKEVPARWLIDWSNNEFARGPLQLWIKQNLNSIKLRLEPEIVYISDKLKK